MENRYRPATALEMCEFDACGRHVTDDLTGLINQIDWVGTTDDGSQPEFVEYLLRKLKRLKKDIENRRSYLITKPMRTQERNRLRERRLTMSKRVIELLKEVDSIKKEIEADSELIRALNKEEEELAFGYKRHSDE